MRIVGLVTEFNPLHLGHVHYIKESKSISNASHVVAVMSPNFVQRGEPAIIDKWSRAKLAINEGVDLVLELPTIYATQSAERFSNCSIAILNKIPNLHGIVFGSENGNINLLKKISALLNNTNIEKEIFSLVKDGLSYPQARDQILKKHLTLKEINNLSLSNNILAISYLKYIQNHSPNLKTYTIKRIGANYNDLNIKKLSSASAIRKELLSNTNFDLKTSLPPNTLKALISFKNNHQVFGNIDAYYNLIQYKFLDRQSNFAEKIIDYEPGLENRIYNAFKNSANFNDAINQIHCKRYTKTRIQRFLIHSALNITKKMYQNSENGNINYIRVLAANKRGLEILSHTKKNSNVNIVTQFNKSIKYLPEKEKKFLLNENYYSNIYYKFINSNNFIDSELTTNPFNH